MITLGGQAQLGIGIAIQLQDNFSKTAASVNRQLLLMHKNANSAVMGAMRSYRDTQANMAMASAAILYGFYNAAKAGSEFQHKINQIAIVGGSALGKTRDQLSAFAKELSGPGGFTRTPAEIAGAMFENTKAGVTSGMELITKYQIAVASATDESLEGQQGVAHGLLNIMNAMDMGIGQFPRIANAVATAANISQASVLSLNESMQYFANTAHIAGLNLEETLALISRLSQSGIEGSSAGTALSNMIMHSTKSVGMFQSPKNKKAWDAMGINSTAVVDLINRGKWFDLIDVVDKATKNMPRQMKGVVLDQIFGVRGNKALINMFGDSDPSKTFRGMLLDIQKGVKGDLAMTQSRAMMNDMYSDMKFLGNAFESLKIALSKNEVFRVAIGGLTKFVNLMVRIADTPIGGALIGLTAIAASLGLVMFGLRAAAMAAMIGLNNMAAMGGVGGFSSLMRAGAGMLGNTMMSTQGLTRNVNGIVTVAAGQTVNVAGKVFKGGQILPKAFQGIGAASMAGGGLAGSLASVGTNFFSKALPWLGRIVGFGLKWLPVIGWIVTIASILDSMFGIFDWFRNDKKKEREPVDPVKAEYQRQMSLQKEWNGLRTVDPGFDKTKEQWERTYGKGAMTQNLVVNLNGKEQARITNPIKFERDLNENFDFNIVQ